MTLTVSPRSHSFAARVELRKSPNIRHINAAIAMLAEVLLGLASGVLDPQVVCIRVVPIIRPCPEWLCRPSLSGSPHRENARQTRVVF
jgi:hypothetical protein